MILGKNGSGKSTLLQIISGITLPSEGEIEYSVSGNKLEANSIYREVSYAAPYVELFEQLTLNEMLDVHKRFKTIRGQMSNDEIIERIYLEEHREKKIEVFSSGMKQRLKLALAIYSESSLLLLDEPITNLDDAGKNWYLSSIEEFKGDRTIIVCSNHQSDEYAFCDHKYILNANKD